MNAVFTFFNTLSQIHAVLGSTADMVKSVQSPNLTTTQKVFQVAVGGLVNGFQLGLLFPNISKNSRFRMCVILGVADVAQQVNNIASSEDELNVGDSLRLMQSTAFRAAQIIDERIELQRDFLGSHQSAIKGGVNALGVVSVLLLIGDAVIQYLGRKPNQIDFVRGFLEEGHSPELDEDSAFEQSIHLLRSIDNITQLNEIPDLFELDEVLSKYKCSLRGSPIRHIYMLKGTENRTSPIYYERDVILNYLRNHPLQRPTSWPETIPYDVAFLEPNLSKQKEIDGRLELFLSDIKLLPDTQITHDLLGINLEKNDLEMVDDLFEKICPEIRSQIIGISINTVQQVFEEGRAPKLARKIEILTKGSGRASRDFSTEECYEAIDSFLRGKEDVQLSKELLQAYKKIEILLSQNSQTLRIKVSS